MTNSMLHARLAMLLLLVLAAPSWGQSERPDLFEPPLSTEAARPNLTADEMRLLKEWAGRLSSDPTATPSVHAASRKQEGESKSGASGSGEAGNGKAAEKKP